MATKEKGQEWWDNFEEVEKKWKGKRQKERLEEARKLQKDQEEFEQFSQNPHILKPLPKVENIIGTESKEPTEKKARLQSMQDFHQKLPLQIEEVIYEQKDFSQHPIQIIPKGTAEEREKAYEYLAYHLRKAFEFQTNGKIEVILTDLGAKEFLIKGLEGNEFIPLCKVFCPTPEKIEIKILKSSFPYFHGYFFDIEDVVHNYLIWLKSSIIPSKN
jgi:hypothetical protein